jgi:hypothetical protein
VSQTRRFPLGQYRGLRFGITLHPVGGTEIYLEGAGTRDTLLSRDHHGPRAVLNALERLAGGYDMECERVGKDLSIAESQLRDYQARQGMPFVHEEYLRKLSDLRDRLKAGLSSPQPAVDGGTTGAEAEECVTVSQLAEQIKALRSANTVEAPPERTERRRDEGEEPVTARIRRRAEERAAGEENNGQERENDGTWLRRLTEQSRKPAEQVRETA